MEARFRVDVRSVRNIRVHRQGEPCHCGRPPLGAHVRQGFSGRYVIYSLDCPCCQQVLAPPPSVHHWSDPAPRRGTIGESLRGVADAAARRRTAERDLGRGLR